MSYFLSYYFGLQAAVVVTAVITSIIYRRRRLKRRMVQPPAGFQKTGEIFIDPTTGIKQQVWFNVGSGERFYQNIDNNE